LGKETKAIGTYLLEVKHFGMVFSILAFCGKLFEDNFRDKKVFFLNILMAVAGAA
jgi:hypothetical protein